MAKEKVAISEEKVAISESVVIPKTKPDCTEKCPECQSKVCDHSADTAKLHFNTVLRKNREGKLVH